MNAVQTKIPVDEILVRKPATQQAVGSVPVNTSQDIDAAVKRARSAQRKWAATEMRERMKVVRRFQQVLSEKKDDVTAAISSETGKPRVEALSTEVLLVLDSTRFLLDNAPALLRPERVPHASLAMKMKRGVLLREPWGVIGIISPWNYPFSIPAVETLWALSAGNAVILKPSEFTPLSALKLQELLS